MTTDPIIPPNLTPEDKARAHQAVAEAFNTPGVQSMMREELNEFTDKTKKLSDLFSDIEHNLSDIDAKGLNVVGGENVPLAPTWAGFKSRYRQLLWDSRDLATEIGTSAEQFTAIILPLAASVQTAGTRSKEALRYLDEVIASIDFFITDYETTARKAKVQSDGFAKLKEDIRRFQTRFDEFGKALQAENNAAIAVLTAQITVMVEALAQVNQMVTVAGVALGLSLFVSAVLPLVPGVGMMVINAAASAVDGSVTALAMFKLQAEGLKEGILSSLTQHLELANQNREIVRAREKLKQLSETKIAEVIAGLASFEIIWNAVNADCVAIKKYLSDVKSGSQAGTPPVVLIGYMKSANTIYTGLTRALKDYAIGIVHSGVTEP